MAAARKDRSLPARLALSAIRLYQRHLSPIKGFSCAWRVATGGASCSAYGARAIGRHGLRTGLALLERRLQRCGAVHRARLPAADPLLQRQRGHCDCVDVSMPCDTCDLGSGGCDCGPGLGNCNWPSRDHPGRRCEPFHAWREQRWMAKAARLQRERLERERRERFARERKEREQKAQGPKT